MWAYSLIHDTILPCSFWIVVIAVVAISISERRRAAVRAAVTTCANLVGDFVDMCMKRLRRLPNRNRYVADALRTEPGKLLVRVAPALCHAASHSVFFIAGLVTLFFAVVRHTIECAIQFVCWVLLGLIATGIGYCLSSWDPHAALFWNATALVSICSLLFFYRVASVATLLKVGKGAVAGFMLAGILISSVCFGLVCLNWSHIDAQAFAGAAPSLLVGEGGTIEAPRLADVDRGKLLELMKKSECITYVPENRQWLLFGISVLLDPLTGGASGTFRWTTTKIFPISTAACAFVWTYKLAVSVILLKLVWRCMKLVLRPQSGFLTRWPKAVGDPVLDDDSFDGHAQTPRR